ncbi:hypothetical protein [Bradyrhizobium cenepequi]|jgi:hypothetical protein
MKAMSALAVLVLSLAPAFGAQASTFGHWCERAVRQRMLPPAAYHRVNLIEAWQQPIFFDPYFDWSGLPQRPPGRLIAFVEYDLRNRFGAPLRSAAKCVYGRD